MAATIVQHKTGQDQTNTNTVAVTVTSTVAGNLLIVCCANVYATTVTSVTDDKGNLYAQADQAVASSATGTLGTDIWYCVNPIGGVTTVTIHFAGVSAAFREGWVYEVSGFQNASFDTAGHVNDQVASASTDTGASVTTRSTNGIVVGVVATSHAVTANPKAGNEFTSGGDIQPTTGNAACSLISSTAAAHQPTWTDTTGGNYCSSTAAFWAEPRLFFPVKLT